MKAVGYIRVSSESKSRPATVSMPNAPSLKTMFAQKDGPWGKCFAIQGCLEPEAIGRHCKR